VSRNECRFSYKSFHYFCSITYILMHCGIFTLCGSCCSTEALRNAIAQQQSSAAKPRLASPPFPSLCSALCIARLLGKHWIAQQWGVMWPPRHHTQQYTTLRSPTCQTPAFIRETKGSSASSVRVSVHMLVATESSRQFATESSQPVCRQLSKWVISASCEECFCEEKTYV
jgi:hypothetical protein